MEPQTGGLVLQIGGDNPLAASRVAGQANAVHVHVMVEAAVESGIGLGGIIPIFPEP